MKNPITHKRPQTLVLIIIFWCSSLLPVAAQTRQAGGTLIYRARDEIQTLDPPLIEDSATYNIAGNIFEGLVRYQGESATIEPALARSWKVSKDGLHWIFFLRKGVYFHDNTMLDAEAVLFSLLRQKDPQHPFYNPDFLYKDVLFAQVKSIRAIDLYTIEFELIRPYSPFLHVLTMPPAAIISPTAVKNDAKNFGRQPVGTGPFRVAEWTELDFALEPFERYWGNKPKLDRIVIQPAKYLKNMLLAMRQDNLHLASNVTQQELLWIQGDSEIQLKQNTANQASFLAFNMERKIFQDKRVRQAFQYVLNKKKLVRWLWQGNAVPASSPIPPNNWSFKKINEPVQQFEKARQLLTEAGYADGFSVKLLAPVRRDPAWPRLFKAVIIASRAVGIQINLHSVPFRDYLTAIQNQDYDIVLLGWATDHADPDGFITPLLHSKNASPGNLSNLSYYRSKTLDRLIEQAQQIESETKRRKIYHQIQDHLYLDPPWIPLIIPNTSYLHHRRVHDVQVSVTGRVLLENLWMEKE
ncbi:MAG: hypothetical protein HQM14_08795 [SAR324 cluster bacterium]|nr:hypothetical protein [SAR324 cluster bacterium]